LLILLGLVALGAMVLRLRHIAADLPDFLEEAAPFRTALDMWSLNGGHTDWNPHSFVYPSLGIYLHFLVQKLGYSIATLRGAVNSPGDWWVLYLLDPADVVIPARLVHVVLGTSTVLLTGLVAERLRGGAGIPAALLAAFSPTLIGTSRLIYTDTLMTALALAGLERMLAWHQCGGSARLVTAVGFIGLAAGAKYPGAVVLIPLAWVLRDRCGARGLATWLAAALGAGALFLLTTPYAILDFAALKRGLVLHAIHVAGGHLGQSTTGTPATYFGDLLRNLGPAGVTLVLVSPWLLVRRRGSRGRAIAVWLLMLSFLLPMALARYAFEYYLVPVIPAAAALAAATAAELSQRFSSGRRPVVAGALTAVLLGPVFVAGLSAAAGGGVLTQIEARRWLEARLAPRDLLLSETWGPKLPSLRELLEVQGSPYFSTLRADVRERYLSRRWFHVVELPLTVAGRVAGGLTAADGTRTEVDVFPSPLDINRVAYDPRLFVSADWVVTSGAVRDRFEADPARFTDECRLYRLLDSTATVEARFEARGGVSGPTETVYRIGPRAHLALAAFGPLSSLWWAERIPDPYRRTVTELFQVPWEGNAVLRPDGTPTLWVRTLAPIYRSSLRSFANDLATNLVDLGRCDAAQPLVEGTLLALPRDQKANYLQEVCTSGRTNRAGAR
jgi:hypothetical protein